MYQGFETAKEAIKEAHSSSLKWGDCWVATKDGDIYQRGMMGCIPGEIIAKFEYSLSGALQNKAHTFWVDDDYKPCLSSFIFDKNNQQFTKGIEFTK